MCGAQDLTLFDAAVDATVELIFCTSAGGVPHPHQLPLAQKLVHAVSLLPACLPDNLSMHQPRRLCTPGDERERQHHRHLV